MNMNRWSSNGPGVPDSAASVNSLVELSISASNLRDMDIFSKSDPICVISIKPFSQTKTVRHWKEILRTECVKNTLNPKFTRKLQIPYHFEEQQYLKFDLYDIDCDSAQLNKHDFLGTATCTLGQIASAGGGESGGRGRTFPLINPSYNGNCGEITVTAEEIFACNDEVEFQFRGKNLDKKDFFGSSDPFLQISRANENVNEFTLVHRTEYLRNNVNPVWNEFLIPVRSLCNGDHERSLKIECFDYNQNGKHSYIGEFYTTLRRLLEGPGPLNMYYCINGKKKTKKRNYKNSGEIHLIHSKFRKGYSFLDYVRSGTQLACTISIDFTSSNGNPQKPKSLHNISSNELNQYELAIEAVGNIIEDYDSDKLFPVLGFGARIPPDGRVSHEFYVNGHPNNPYCERISGVLAAYRSCIRSVQLYGPTHFAPTIHHVSRIARNFMDGSQYFILLIITDGIITDMEQTKSAIVDAAILPLSIIIVGVGAADFTKMDELDGDTIRLTDQLGRKACRDIVQFVPFRNFCNSSIIDNQATRAHLAKEVLTEIPEQFLSFMKSRNIIPQNIARNAAPTLLNLPPDPELLIQKGF